jgi:predicted amidohydrolase
MRDIKIAAAQFENRNGDKAYNLACIHKLTEKAVAQGAEIVSFHEVCVPAYTFMRKLDREQLLSHAEAVPDGPSTQELISIAAEFKVAILAGLLEEAENRLHNTYICVTGEGLQARFRKLHPFINKNLSPGHQYVVFDLFDCRCGILTCYDNNIVENVRMTTLLGAEIIFMPHVTGCLPSPMPGRGLVDPSLWRNRDRDPVALQMELDGPKGRGWLLRWLPARAYDNGIYAVFTNPVGMDDDQVRNGNAMILDPFGEVVVECRTPVDDVCVGLCTPEKIPVSHGYRYLSARRPELFDKLVEPPEKPPTTSPGWDTGS